MQNMERTDKEMDRQENAKIRHKTSSHGYCTRVVLQ